MQTQVVYTNVVSGQTYSIPFEWLDNSQIVVYGDSELLIEGTQYTLNKTACTITPLSNFSELSVTRETIESDLSYDFESTKSLRAAELQRALDIIRHIAEESESRGLKLGADGNYDAGGKRITNIAGMVEPQDAVNKAALDSVNQTLTNLINAYAAKEQYLIDGGFPDSDFERIFDGGGAYNG